jgi:hypothetical protein
MHSALPEFEFRDTPAPRLKKPTHGNLNALTYVGHIGFAVAGPILIGAYAGSTLDARWLTGQRYTVIGLCIGTVIAIIGFIGIVKEMTDRRL